MITNENGILYSYTKSGKRKMGVLDGDKFIIERNKKKHILRVLNAYGINWELINKSTKIKQIELRESKGKTYLFPLQLVKDKGITKQLGGFELQYFIPLSELKKFEVETQTY